MSHLEATGANAPQIEYWNGPAGDRWAKLADSQDIMLEALGSAAIDACDIRSGHTVLDIGCGSGTTTIETARMVGPEGRVVGIDISTPMLEIGRARLQSLETLSVTFDNKDAAIHPFEKNSFDRVLSRFGVMFFVEPIAAFANIRSGMKSGGRMAFVCWQALENNPWLEIPFKIALQYVPAPPPPDPEAPGPMAFSDPDRIRRILSGAGFAEIDTASLETTLPVGSDVRTTAQRLAQLGSAARLPSDASEDIKSKVEEDLSKRLAEFQTEQGVLMDSATWIVSATSP